LKESVNVEDGSRLAPVARPHPGNTAPTGTGGSGCPQGQEEKEET
jgi:hypothetical protein